MIYLIIVFNIPLNSRRFQSADGKSSVKSAQMRRSSNSIVQLRLMAVLWSPFGRRIVALLMNHRQISSWRDRNSLLVTICPHICWTLMVKWVDFYWNSFERSLNSDFKCFRFIYFVIFWRKREENFRFIYFLDFYFGKYGNQFFKFYFEIP